jgi:hypothetical protein
VYGMSVVKGWSGIGEIVGRYRVVACIVNGASVKPSGATEIHQRELVNQVAARVSIVETNGRICFTTPF